MKKILTLGIGAFGFAVLKHLGTNNPNMTFYACERNQDTFEYIKKYKTHPHFFDDVKLPGNIKYVDIDDMISEADIVIVAIPAHCVTDFFEQIRKKLKPGVGILNLTKGIDNKTLHTTGELIEKVLSGSNYSYGVLAGGMIAHEMVSENMLGADLVTKDLDFGSYIQSIFASTRLDIYLVHSDTRTTELYASLKNVFAIILGYYQVQGLEMSSIGYYTCKIYREIDELIDLLGSKTKIEFSNYANGGDIIATCFGDSRNKYFGTLLGSGHTVEQALEIMKQQNKLAEGYYTFQGVYTYVKDRPGFEEIKKIGRILTHNMGI